MKTTCQVLPSLQSLASLWMVMAGLSYHIHAAAEAPMHTDDASTLEPGALKLETVWSRDHHAHSNSILFGGGVLPGLELGIALARTASPENVDPRELSVKWIPWQQEQGWSLGARLDLGSTRVRSAGLAAFTERSFAVTALASYRLHNAQLLHINIGHTSAKAEGVRRSAATWALGYEWPLAERLQLTSEVYGQRHARPDKGVGLRYTIAEGLKASAALGRGNGRNFAQLGMAWEF